MASDIKNSDANVLSKIGKNNLQFLYDYSINSLNRIQTRFAAIDSKASQTIGLIAVVGGILVFAGPTTDLKNYLNIYLLFIGVICFIIATLCCLLCLRVRPILEAPMVKSAIKWINERKKEDIDIKLFSSLIVDIANAENSHLKIYNIKAKHLAIGQAFEVTGIIFLLIFLVLSKIF